MRHDFTRSLRDIADQLGVDATEHLARSLRESRMEFHRAGETTCLVAVHMRTEDSPYPTRMDVAVTRPGEGLSGWVPSDGVATARDRAFAIGAARGGHVDVLGVVRDEVRRSLGMPIGLVRERGLDRAFREALGDDVDATADLVARLAVERGFARELAAALEARLEAAPGP